MRCRILIPLRVILGRSTEPPGRFLKQNDKIKLWEDVGDKKASEKMSQPRRRREDLL